MSRGLWYGLLAGLVVFAFGVRRQYLAVLVETAPPARLQANWQLGWADYGHWARRLADGNGYDRLSHPPGYTLFLAGLLRAGITAENEQRLAQAALDSLAVLLVTGLLRRLGLGRGTALLGGLGYAVYPPLAVGSICYMSEWCSPLFVVGTLWLLVSAARGPGLGRWLAAGLWIGLAGMVRADLVLLIGPAGLWALWQAQGWRRLTANLALAAGFLVPVGAWGWHNHQTHGLWLFTSTSGGPGLWEGLGEVPNDYGYVLNDRYTARLVESHGHAWWSPEADRFLKQEYLRACQEHPFFVARVIAIRWAKILFRCEWWRPYALAEVQQALTRGGLLLLAVALVVARKRPPLLLALALPVAYACLSIGLVHYEPRYVRYAQLSYLWAALVLGKAAWQWLAARARRPARLLAAFGLGALTWYVGTETYRLQVAAGEDREAQELAHEIDQDSRPPTWSLADLPWKAVAPCQQEATADGAIRLTTSHGDYEIQILAQINDPAAATACVAYELEVKRGIVAVGVLDSFGQWVWQNGYRAGVHRQEVPFGASGRGKWTLVVMNSLPDRGVSEVVIRKMDVFLAPP